MTEGWKNRIIHTEFRGGIALLRKLSIGLFNERPGCVLFGDDAHGEGPSNPERRIIVAQAAGMARRVEFTHLIEHFGVVGESLEPVRKQVGNVKGASIFGA